MQKRSRTDDQGVFAQVAESADLHRVAAFHTAHFYRFDEIERLEKLMNGTGRVLIRPSGTQPLVRVMLEGKDEGQIRELAQGLADLIKEKLA